MFATRNGKGSKIIRFLHMGVDFVYFSMHSARIWNDDVAHNKAFMLSKWLQRRLLYFSQLQATLLFYTS